MVEFVEHTELVVLFTKRKVLGVDLLESLLQRRPGTPGHIIVGRVSVHLVLEHVGVLAMEEVSLLTQVLNELLLCLKRFVLIFLHNLV